jgi:hypothetical protein
MTMPSMKQEGTTVLYFDNYGGREALETMTEMKVAGQSIKMHQLRFNKDGYVYDLDLTAKTGIRRKGGSVVASTDMSSLSEKMMEKYHVKKEGTENIAGKPCDVMSMDDGSGMKGRVASWNGIPMMSDMQVSGMPIKTVVTKLEEGAKIPDSKFEVPADVKVRDM